MAPVKTHPGSKPSPKTKASPKIISHPKNKSPSKPKTATSDITQGTTDTLLADGLTNTITSTTPVIPNLNPATLPNIDPATGIPILVDETTDWEALLTRVQSLMSQLIGALEDETPARHTGPSSLTEQILMEIEPGLNSETIPMVIFTMFLLYKVWIGPKPERHIGAAREAVKSVVRAPGVEQGGATRERKRWCRDVLAIQERSLREREEGWRGGSETSEGSEASGRYQRSDGNGGASDEANDESSEVGTADGSEDAAEQGAEWEEQDVPERPAKRRKVD